MSSTRLDPDTIPTGRWAFVDESRWNRARPYVATLCILGAIAALGTIGGRLVARHGWSHKPGVALLALGGGIALGNLIGVACRRGSRAETVRFASWNVGTANDGYNMDRARGLQVNHQLSGAQAWRRIKEDTTPATYDRNQVAQQRLPRLRAELQRMAANRCDVICLQETGDKSNLYLADLLPAGYRFVTNLNGSRSAILYNTQRVHLVATAQLTYPPTWLNSDGDAMVMLQTRGGKRFAVCSSHCQGYNLSRPGAGSQGPENGDYQAIYNAKTMDLVRQRIDFAVYAGDFNVRRDEQGTQRISYLTDNGFITAEDMTAPTIYDANLTDRNGDPLAVRLDHGFVKPGDLSRGKPAGSIRGCVVSREPLWSLDRPSDHIPIGFDIDLPA
jgi:exonuclease III